MNPSCLIQNVFVKSCSNKTAYSFFIKFENKVIILLFKEEVVNRTVFGVFDAEDIAYLMSRVER